MALAAANSPRIHDIYTSLSSGIQLPATAMGGGNWSLSDGGATFPGGIAIGGGNNKGRKRSNDLEKQNKKKVFFVFVFCLDIRQDL